MKLDPVHDLQGVFRKILAATASPGAIVDIGREAGLLDFELPFNKGILIVALALLDAETTFRVASVDSETLERTISQLTYAKAAGPCEAGFVFVLDQDGAAEAIAAARAGTLVDPHLGATIVIETEALEEGGPLLLTGPGIESTVRLGVALEPDWIDARSAKNAEFPLGVDLIFVDALFRLAAMPRTTVVSEAR